MASLDELSQKVAELQQILANETKVQKKLEEEVAELTTMVKDLKRSKADAREKDFVMKVSSSDNLPSLSPNSSAAQASPPSVSSSVYESSPSKNSEGSSRKSSSSRISKRASVSSFKGAMGKSDLLAEGNVEKKSIKKNNWRKIRFELRRSPSYAYILQYVNKDVLKGMIQFENSKLYSHVEHHGEHKPLLFCIRSEKKNIHLRTTTIEDKQRWCAALKEFMPEEVAPYEMPSRSKETPPSPQSAPISPAAATPITTPTTTTENLSKTGFLSKKELTYKTSWKRCWAILDRNGLTFKDEKDSKQANRVIPFDGAELFTYCEKRKIPQPLLFNIRQDGNDYILEAVSKEEKDEWCRMIKEFVQANLQKISEVKPTN